MIVRLIAEGKFELVIGERRYRASVLAGKKTIPVMVRELTDEQVKEMQLIENLQRENPHPMAEAIGIYQLLNLKSKKTNVEEISKRIGRSVAYVYQRIKLYELIENFREMFFADVFNITQALKIARLDKESQEEFFNAHCKNWMDENWSLHNFDGKVDNYQLDLDDAPFDIKDAKLDKKAGACTKCPHNIAVTTSLFPEDEEEARCTHRACYENKCKLHKTLQLVAIFTEHKDLPIAVEDDTVISAMFGNDDSLIKGRTLLIENIDYFDEYQLPEKPIREDFDYSDSEEDNEEEYQGALQEYESELKQAEQEIAEGNYYKAILLKEDGDAEVVYVDRRDHRVSSHSSSSHNSSFGLSKPEFKAKDYQEAVKAKTLTAETIDSERQRLIAREKRSKELDEEKLQISFYEALEGNENAFSDAHPAGINDRAVWIFLMYDSLNFQWKRKFSDLVLEKVKSKEEESEKLFSFYFNATENQISVLARMALLNKAEAKMPNQDAGQLLRLMVEGTEGMDAAELVNIQRTIAKEREVKLEEKLAILDKQAEKVVSKEKMVEKMMEEAVEEMPQE